MIIYLTIYLTLTILLFFLFVSMQFYPESKFKEKKEVWLASVIILLSPLPVLCFCIYFIIYELRNLVQGIIKWYKNLD